MRAPRQLIVIGDSGVVGWGDREAGGWSERLRRHWGTPTKYEIRRQQQSVAAEHQVDEGGFCEHHLGNLTPMDIPPGDSTCLHEWSARFNALMDRF